MNEEEITEEHFKLAEERLKSMPYYIEISIGIEGEIHTFDKGELKEHLEERDEIGRKFAKLQLETIRSLSD